MLRDPFRRDGPIVTAMGDDDFYKLSMLGLIWAEARLRRRQRYPRGPGKGIMGGIPPR